MHSRRAAALNDPAKLDRRIDLLSPNTAANAIGEQVPEWAKIATVWAAKTPVTGQRMTTSDARHYEALTRFRIRHRTDITTAWRVVHGRSTYEVTSVEEQGRAHFLDLVCRAIDQEVGSR
jgi:SPP1 family predicted phage head-tail adaptor